MSSVFVEVIKNEATVAMFSEMSTIACNMWYGTKTEERNMDEVGEETSLLIGSNLLIEPLGGSEFFASFFHQLTLDF